MAATQYPQASDLLGPLFEEVFARPRSQGARARDLLRSPEADVVETEEAIRVVMDAPGMRPDDIELSLENNVLTISGERQPEWRESEEVRFRWHLAERRYGRFSRTFVLPRDVDAERIQARFENGVLGITIPKSEKVRRRRIEIQADGAARQIDASTDG